MAALNRRSASGITARFRSVLSKLVLATRGTGKQTSSPPAPEWDLPFLHAYFTNIVELSEDAIISIDAQQRIRLFNKGAEAIFGYQAAEVLGEPLDILLPARFQGRHRMHVAGFAASADSMRSMNERGSIVGVRKDGTEFPAEATITKFTVKGESVLSVRLRDITQRRRAEEGLQRLAALVESSDDAIIGKSLDGTIISWNKGAERIYGYAASEVLGRHISILVPPEGRDELPRLFARVARGDSVNRLETVRVAKDGRRIDISLSLSPVKDATGSVIGMSAIGRDITEQKRLDTQLRQAQKMETIGALAGGIAHDFNNVLNLLSGHAELAALRLPLASPARDHLQEVIAASQRATELVRQILVFSRRTQQERRAVALQVVVEEVRRLLLASLPSSVEFRQHMDAAPAVVLAEPSQIHQVLLNLCANAEYAMRNKSGVLDLHLRTVSLDAKFAQTHPPLQPGPHVKLTIRDTGVGMVPEVQERIFEPFFTTKPIGEGTGLGLATVYSIVKSHGGAITVESAPGRGARFDLYFPRCDETLDILSKPQAPVKGSGEHILLVDDETSLLRLWTVALTDLGYHVTAFSGSRDALDAFLKAPDTFDLVVTDQTMPQMSGEALARELLRMRPQIPIILCTGHLPQAGGTRIAPVGIRATLIKPISRLDLSLTIYRLLTENVEANTSTTKAGSRPAGKAADLSGG